MSQPSNEIKTKLFAEFSKMISAVQSRKALVTEDFDKVRSRLLQLTAQEVELHAQIVAMDLEIQALITERLRYEL
jgi:hypothetical protein